jgi:hypothetical protein
MFLKKSSLQTSFFSGCCIIVLVVFGNVAFSQQISTGVKQAKADIAALTSGQPIAAGASTSVTDFLPAASEEKAARWSRMVLNSVEPMVRTSFAQHLPVLACFMTYVSGTA